VFGRGLEDLERLRGFCWCRDLVLEGPEVLYILVNSNILMATSICMVDYISVIYARWLQVDVDCLSLLDHTSSW
jgi:hypothetical protein